VTGSVIVTSIPGPTVIDKIAQRTEGSLPWYLSRASGLVAAGALLLLMLSGIGLITGGMFRFLEPLTAWASHRALGLTFGVAVLVHIFSLLFDHFVSFQFLDLFVPWLSTYKPVTIGGIQFGSLYVALGVLAFYAVAIVIITSLVWVEKKPHLWKLIHFLTYLVMVFVFVHALYLGSDLADGIPRALWVIGGFIVGIAILARLRRTRTS
jgi:predicted ferric reductase